jgi:hypothetical protein
MPSRGLSQSLPLEDRLAGLSEEEVRQSFENRNGSRANGPRKPRKKK